MLDQLDQILLGDPARRLAFGAILLLLAGVAAIWLRRHPRRLGDPASAQRSALALVVVLSSVGLGVVFSAYWDLPGVIVLFVVAMIVCGAGMVVMLVRGPHGSSRAP
jgi:hypothetical protein